jgi:hypothetical protein
MRDVKDARVADAVNRAILATARSKRILAKVREDEARRTARREQSNGFLGTAFRR